jgi:hypothetical protein
MIEASRWVVSLDLAAEDCKTPLLTHHVTEARGLPTERKDGFPLLALLFFFLTFPKLSRKVHEVKFLGPIACHAM